MRTERLVLRRFTEDDLDDLVTLDGDAEVMRYLQDGQPRSRTEIARSELPRRMTTYDDSGRFGHLVAQTQRDRQFIGWFGSRPVLPGDGVPDEWPTREHLPSVVTLSYRLRRSAWGHGYATEGAHFITDRVFAEPGIERVVANTMAVNAASRRVLDKLGFSHVRTLHLDWPHPIPGTEEGEVEYHLTRSQWRAQAASVSD